MESLSGGSVSKGGFCPRGVSGESLSRGGLCPVGPCLSGKVPLHTVTCGQYAFYWKAFLFFNLFSHWFPLSLVVNRPLNFKECKKEGDRSNEDLLCW